MIKNFLAVKEEVVGQPVVVGEEDMLQNVLMWVLPGR